MLTLRSNTSYKPLCWVACAYVELLQHCQTTDVLLNDEHAMWRRQRKPSAIYVAWDTRDCGPSHGGWCLACGHTYALRARRATFPYISCIFDALQEIRDANAAAGK